MITPGMVGQEKEEDGVTMMTRASRGKEEDGAMMRGVIGRARPRAGRENPVMIGAGEEAKEVGAATLE